MKYRLTYTRRSIKDIAKLDRIVKKRIAKRLLDFEKEPFKLSEHLKDYKFGKRRFRIGDYRVTFDIEDEEIVILRVGHRRKIYKS